MDKIEIASSMFNALDAGHVDYVSWKSNEHLAEALRGETDVDLLISSEHHRRFVAIVDRLGFVEMRLPQARHVPGLTGYLGYDGSSGVLLHLDVCYRLILGEQLIKNHHLPLEEWLLTDSDELVGVRVPSPAREFLILYVRAMLKTTARQLFRAARRGGSPFPERIQREASWLAGRIDSSEAIEVAASSDLGIAAEELVEFRSRALERRFDWRYVAERKRSLRQRLRRYERSPRWGALSRKLALRLRTSRPIRMLGFGIGPRRLVRRAPLIAVVGADGAGKTRLTRDLTAWLGGKLVVHHVYFGQPKTGSVFKLLRKLGNVTRWTPRDGRDVRPPTARRLLLRFGRYTDDVNWVVLAKRRRRLAAGARAVCRSGEIVIAERFPLEQFRSMATAMDGPRLVRAEGSFIRLLARAESRSYDSIDAPDLVLALSTDLDTLRERKMDLSMEEHSAKAEAVQALEPGPGVVVIDAGKPYVDVLAEAQASVWRALRGGR